MQNYRNIATWQRSHELCISIYLATRDFPDDERFGLTSQMRRAAVSVPSNIAEGSKKKSRLDYARFLNSAESSLSELDYQVNLSRDLGYLPEATASKLLEEADHVARMLSALRDAVETFEKREGRNGRRN